MLNADLPRHGVASALVLLSALTLGVPTTPHASAQAAPPAEALQAALEQTPELDQEQENLFAGFETHVLENGLRVWSRHVPGAANTSAGILIPYGWDMDPRGKEETAHFVEHMLFGDHRGFTEEEIKDQVEARGGSRNGFTTGDRTFYYVTMPTEWGLAGIEWLSRVIEPHDMDPDVVERNRQPVALEIRARPRELFDHIAAVLDPEWLSPLPFWEREFGIETRAIRHYDRYRSLHAITPEDLRAFYDRYYVPEAMTLVVVGDLPGDSARALIENTFGALPPRDTPPAYAPAVDPDRGRKRVTRQFRSNVQYRLRLKVYEADGDAHIRMQFLRRYLDRRLSARLRFGETKAVYGISVALVQRGPANYFTVQAPVDEDEWAFARSVIREELQRVSDGSAPREEFEADRQAVVDRIIAENQESQDLVFWLFHSLNRPGLFEDFPDIAAEFASLEQEDLAAFARANFTPERTVEYIDYPQPLTQGVLAVLVVILGALVMKATATLLTTPVEMRHIRYVARLRLSVPILLAGGSVFFGAALIVLRLWIWVMDRVVANWVFPVESYLFQTLAFALIGSVTLVALMLYASLPPRKLLVFPDHIRVKSKAYRSRIIPLDAIESVARRRLTDVARRGRLFQTLPLSLGVGPAAVHIEVRDAPGYLFRVRDAGELMTVLEELGVPVER